MGKTLFAWTTENQKEVIRLSNGHMREFKTKKELRAWWKGFEDAQNTLSKGHENQNILCKAEGKI